MAQANPFFDVTNNPFMNPENNPFMDTKNNPFVNADMQKMFNGFELPGLDIDGFLAAQRRNLEAISAANKTAAEGVQAVFSRQNEILKTLIEEATASLKDLDQSGAPEAQITKQVELTKVKFEEAVSNIRELSELAAKSQNDAFEILNTRFNESLEEVKSLTAAPKAKAKPAAATKK